MEVCLADLGHIFHEPSDTPSDYQRQVQLVLRNQAPWSETLRFLVLPLNFVVALGLGLGILVLLVDQIWGILWGNTGALKLTLGDEGSLRRTLNKMVKDKKIAPYTWPYDHGLQPVHRRRPQEPPLVLWHQPGRMVSLQPTPRGRLLLHMVEQEG